jgi:hypothetical protein
MTYCMTYDISSTHSQHGHHLSVFVPFFLAQGFFSCDHPVHHQLRSPVQWPSTGYKTWPLWGICRPYTGYPLIFRSVSYGPRFSMSPASLEWSQQARISLASRLVN